MSIVAIQTRSARFPCPSRRRFLRAAKDGRKISRHVLFGEDGAGSMRPGSDQDGMHAAEPLYPFELDPFEYGRRRLDQATPVCSSSPARSGASAGSSTATCYTRARTRSPTTDARYRAELYSRPGRYYYERWNALYERGLEQGGGRDEVLVELEVPGCPSSKTSRS